MVVEQQFCAQSYISYLISPTKQPNVFNYIFINDKMVFLMIIESFFEIYFSLKIKLIFHIICKDRIDTMEAEKHFLSIFMAKIRDDFLKPDHIFSS